VKHSVLVTEGGFENFTKAPKTVEEVERVTMGAAAAK